MKKLIGIFMLVLITAMLLTACGGGGGGDNGGPAPTYTVGGTISGLTGTGLVLQNNSGDNLTVNAGASTFTFATKLADKAAYAVTVKTHPMGQTCVVSNGTGTVSGADISNVSVACGIPALYPANGDDWNDYVKGSVISNATDTACNPAADTACLHGGEIRYVMVTGKSSCAGLTAVDALGAFDWVCDASTGTARFTSTGLKAGKYLSDLIDFTTPGWKANSVSVYDGVTLYYTTPSTAWWHNPVVVDNDGGSLDAAGTIYLVTNAALTPTTGGYIINASSVGIVGEPGTIIHGPAKGSGSNVLSATTKNFLWMEGAVDAKGDSKGIYLYQVKFSVLRNVKANNADTGASIAGVYLFTSCDHNTLTDVTASNNSHYGVHLYSSSYNTFSNLTVSNNGLNGVDLSLSNNNTFTNLTESNSGYGVYLGSSNNNTLTNVTASNNNLGIYKYGVYLSSSKYNILKNVTATNNNYGVYLSGTSNNNTLTNVTAANNATYGVYLDSNSNNALAGVTAANNAANGVRLSSSDNNILSSVSAANNGSHGIYLDFSDRNTFSDVAASNNNTYGVRLVYCSNNKFTGLLKVGNNATSDCYVDSGSSQNNPGLDDDADPSDQAIDAVHDGLCTQQGASDFGTAVTAITLASSFAGKVTSDDTVNASDTNGSVNYGSITDWTGFENPFRGWGKDGSAFPNADNNGQCTAGTCRIWDWSLTSSDTVIRNVLSFPTGTAYLTHTWYVSPAPGQQSDCDAAVPGSTFVTDHCESTFLRRAVEIQGDGIGNDNTLCESDETCLYTLNIGAYQGHGTLIDAGAFTGGTITGVTLKRYQTNGY